MFGSIITAVLGILIMMGLWIVMQKIWKLIFADEVLDEDVLSFRSTCGNCGCVTQCDKNKSNELKSNQHGQII